MKLFPGKFPTAGLLAGIILWTIFNGCKFTNPQKEVPVTEKTVTVSNPDDSYKGGLKSVWFSVSDGNTFAWGPDSVSEAPDTLQTYFKITPGTGEFKALPLQNNLYFGALYLGQGDLVFTSDYLGDSLDLHHNLSDQRILEAGNVYYLRSEIAASQIKITSWDPLDESLGFEWRLLDSMALEEFEHTIELPEEDTEKNVYFFNVSEGSVLAVNDDDSLTEPSEFEFRLDPGQPSFASHFYTDTLPFGIAYLGQGDLIYTSDDGWLGRLTHDYRDFISIEDFQLNSVFYLRTFNGDCKIIILSWNKSTSEISLKWHRQTETLH